MTNNRDNRTPAQILEQYDIDVEDYPLLPRVLPGYLFRTVVQMAEDGEMPPQEIVQYSEVKNAEACDQLEDVLNTIYEANQMEDNNNDNTDFETAADMMDDDTESEYESIFLTVEDEEQQRKIKSGGNSRWSLGAHTMPEDVDSPDVPDVDETVFDQAIEMFEGSQIGEVLGFAKEQAEEVQISGYECPVCGLVHEHADDKHDIRREFAVRDDFVDKMEFNPFCHCGVNELARIMNNFDKVKYQVFEDQGTMTLDQLDSRKRAIQNAADNAPVPSEVNAKLDEMFSNL